VTTTSTATSTSAPTAPEQGTGRSLVLDGLRGLAILLVVLSHSGKVWPADQRPDLGSLDFLFTSGSAAVSIFFVVSGYLVTTGLLSARERVGPTGPPTRFIARTLRISIQTGVLLVAVALVARFDATDTTSSENTRKSLLAAATYTWNTYVRDHVFEARSDIGALYFLAIDFQVFAVITLVVIAVGARRRLLAAVTATVLVGASVWRWVVFENDGWFAATLTTTARMDAILWGVLVALLREPLLARVRSGPLLGASALILTGCVVANSFVGIDAYFNVLGVLTSAATAGMVLAAADRGRRPSMTDDLLGHRALVWAGTASLTIFVWHIPVFETVARHTPAWAPLPRTLLAAIGLAAIIVVVERSIARPVTRWVGHLSRSALEPVSRSPVREAGGEASGRDG
jgi:peptidoglycan/LPS O-acetylase OafA/YrhL